MRGRKRAWTEAESGFCTNTDEHIRALQSGKEVAEWDIGDTYESRVLSSLQYHGQSG